MINCTNNHHQTPILVASAFNHVPIIEYLLEKRARIETRDKERYNTRYMLFSVGLYNLRNSNITFYCNLSYTALLLATVEGNSEAVEVLLRNGADIYVQDKDDKSVLYWAAAQNHQNVIKVCSFVRNTMVK